MTLAGITQIGEFICDNCSANQLICKPRKVVTHVCEMYAVNAGRPVKNDAYLREFFSDSKWNPHGWGLAWHEGTNLRLFKEPVTAFESSYLEYLINMGISCDMLIAHIRNATRGLINYANCHPFVGLDHSGRRWMLMHNGTVIEDELLRPYESQQAGTTDSERVLLLLLERLNEAIARNDGALDAEKRYDVIARLIADLSPNNKLNLVIDDGERTYAHTNTIQPTLYANRQPGVVYLCSRPLGDELPWEALTRCSLFAMERGRIVRMDKVHDGLFDNDHYLQMIAEGLI